MSLSIDAIRHSDNKTRREGANLIPFSFKNFQTQDTEVSF
jgi:hypothetical protein